MTVGVCAVEREEVTHTVYILTQLTEQPLEKLLGTLQYFFGASLNLEHSMQKIIPYDDSKLLPQ
jgi:hypothetical protein